MDCCSGPTGRSPGQSLNKMAAAAGKEWEEAVTRAAQRTTYYSNHRLECPFTVGDMQLWVGMLEQHHEFCRIEDWPRISKHFKAVIMEGGIIHWNGLMRKFFEISISHMVIHWMTDGFLNTDQDPFLPPCASFETPKQGELKLILASLRWIGYSHRIKNWYELVKELLELVGKCEQNYKWDVEHRERGRNCSVSYWKSRNMIET